MNDFVVDITTGIETGAVKTAVRFDRLGDCCCCSVVLLENDGYR